MSDEIDSDDSYDWSEGNLVPALWPKDGGEPTRLPKEMYWDLLALEERRPTISDDEYCDGLCRIMNIERKNLDMAIVCRSDFRQRVCDGDLSLEEAYRLSIS